MPEHPEPPLTATRKLRLLAQAWYYCVWVRLALWLLPLPAFKRCLEPKIEPVAPKHSWVDAAELAWAVETASRLVPCATCLVRAYAGWWWMARCRMPALIHVGVRKHAGRIQAHAWLEAHGRVWLGAHEHETYTPLS